MAIDKNERVKIVSTDTGADFDYERLYEETLVDLSEDIPKPPVAMGIGEHTYKGRKYDNATFTYGEMSVIIAPQKKKKTFFKTALLSGYIGGKVQERHFPNFKTHRDGEKYVLDFDTEQGKYYAQRSFRRVAEMVGHPYENYLAFGLKRLTDDQRLMFIDKVVNDPRYKGKIGWIAIDGIADLCENTNDLEKSKKVIQKLMEWCDQGIHINCVIHKTFEKERGTGHLGSFVQKKAESIIFLSNERQDDKESPILVQQKESRGAPFEDFAFELDKETLLPRAVDLQDDFTVDDNPFE